jgi:hypothetical protein
MYLQRTWHSGDPEITAISNRIKLLISNRYPNFVCFNQGTRIELTYPNILYISLARTVPKSKDFRNPNIFIRIVTVHKSHAPKLLYSISNRWPQNHNDLIWNWKVLKRQKILHLLMKTDTTDRSDSCKRK